MSEKHKGLAYTYYEMSDLENIFCLRHVDSFGCPRDYGTGHRYTTLEVHTITLIEQNPGITVTEISRIFNRTKSSVSQLISRLEKKGLVSKSRPNSNNRRIRNLNLTELGQKLSESHVSYDEARFKTYVDKFLEFFSIDELNTAYRFLAVMMSKNIKSVEDSQPALEVAEVC